MVSKRQRRLARLRRQANTNQGLNRQRITNTGQRQAQEGNLRTITIAAPFHAYIKEADTEFFINGSMWPLLGRKLADAIQWRIRSARISYETVDPDAKGRIGLFLAPTGSLWKPTKGLASILTMGGTSKLARQSGWSSNTLGAIDAWYDTGSAAAMLYLGSSIGTPTSNDVGQLVLHVTFQVIGHK
jgi:hypothetical protein